MRPRPHRLRACVGVLVAVVVVAATQAAASARPDVARAASSAGSADVFSNPRIPPDAVPAPAPRADERITLALGLANDRAGLAAFVAAVANPTSPDYGRHLPLREVKRRFGATAATTAAVRETFAAEGISTEIDSTATMAYVTGPSAAVAGVFGTGLARWRLASGATILAPTSAPVLPAGLAGHVTAVAGLNTLGLLPHVGAVRPTPGAVSPTSVNPPWATRTGVPVGCPDAVATGAFMPNQLNTAYGADALVNQGYTGIGRRVAIIDFGLYDPADFRAAANCFGATAPDPIGHVIDTSIDADPSAQQEVRIETALDIETVIAAAKQLGRIDVFIDSYVPRMLAAAIDPANTGGVPPDVVSSSIWPGCEPVLGAATTQAFDQVAAAAAATGVTFLTAAGDHGSSDCYGTVTGAGATVAATSWPASSTYVSGIGGTNLLLNNAGPSANTISATEVWNDLALAVPGPRPFGGGGYHSSVFGRPSWQNTTGVDPALPRQVPDVAFFADLAPGWPMVCRICGVPPVWIAVGGTSAATPYFAGVMALFAQKAAATRQPVFGTLNPLLYQLAGADYAGVFTDITVGDNDMFSVGCCVAGAGYDQASGLGSIKIGGMDAALTPPVAAVRANIGIGSPGLNVTFDASGSQGTATRPVVRYDWDFDGNGTIDASGPSAAAQTTYWTNGVFTPQVWAVNAVGRRAVATTQVSIGAIPYGIPGDVAVPGAWGSATSQVPGVFRPATGQWFARGIFDGGITYGGPGDIAVPMDCDGNGILEPTIYRPSTGMWFNATCFPGGIAYGAPGDIPIPGPYLSTTSAWQPAVFRPSTGYWYIQGAGAGPFGGPGDVPIVYRLGAAGATGQVPAVFRPSNSTFYNAATAPGGVRYGIPGDIPVPGAYALSASTVPAVFRPSTGTWYIQGIADAGIPFGIPSDVPRPFAPSGLSTVPAVFRAGTWFVRS